ncbi:MAG: dihydroorotate dehydrogenase [Candidatus Aenigmarchaeota archaeon]|nr:dihydroorotate dehydrogenase [Candidatus Aenigmarchaeota archaeon]
MKYQLFGKEISGPFTIPAGIVATELSTLEKIAREIPEIGILTTKSIGSKAREGNREPIIAQYTPYSFINAVGLANPGSQEFAKRLSKIKIPEDKFLLISIFGSNENEFKEVAGKLLEHGDGFELNISCPHSDKYGQVIGQDRVLVEKITKSVTSLGKPVVAKISPNLDVKETVASVIKGGASGITAINTKGPELYLHDGYLVLSNKVGGISGKAILELGIKCVREIRKITSSLPVIACGGISTAEDIKRYKKAGANFFGIGSALVGMNTEEIKEYFHELLNDVESGTNNGMKFLKEKLKMEYRKFRVKKNEQLAEDLFLLELDGSVKVEPGQFIFTWLPERGEKPFSVFDDEPLTLLVRKKGYFTTELSKLKKGDMLYIRGPYGNSPKVDGRILLVGGGTGIAALLLFARKNKKAVAVLGAKDRKHLACVKKFSVTCEEVYLATESGEVGNKGMVTDNLEKIIEKTQPNYCINCGPEAMVKIAIQKESKYVDLERIYSSIEFLTKCGIGLCGSCATSKGYRICVDGTFLTPMKI